MAIMEQAFNALPEAENSDYLKKKLLEIAQQQGQRVADIMPANENVVRGNPMLLETQLANVQSHPEYKKYKDKIASMNSEVIPSQYTPPTAQEENDVASIPVETPVETPAQPPVQPTATQSAPAQPFDAKPLGLGIARGVGLLGDVFRGDRANSTQDAITGDIDRERAYLRQKLLDEQKTQTGIDEKDDPNSEVSMRSVETLASLYPDFADTFGGKSYNENNKYVQYVNTLTAEQRRAEAEKRRQELSVSARAEGRAKIDKADAEKDEQTNIIGWNRLKKVSPSVASKAIETLGQMSEVEIPLDSAVEHIKKYGVNSFSPANITKLQSIMSDFLTGYGKYKGLGALSESDLQIAEDIRGKRVTGDMAIKNLMGFKDRINKVKKDKMLQLGYEQQSTKKIDTDKLPEW